MSQRPGRPGSLPRGVPLRQASLQKRTSAQQRAHFFRQAKGRPQAGQILVGRSAFLTPRMPRKETGRAAGASLSP